MTGESGQAKARQADRIGDGIKHDRDRCIYPQICRSSAYDITHEARAFFQLDNSNVIRGIIDKFRRFVLVNDSIRIDHAAPTDLLPTQRARSTFHAIQAGIKLVMVARLAVLQQQRSSLAALPERAILFRNHRQRFRTTGIWHDVFSIQFTASILDYSTLSAQIYGRVGDASIVILSAAKNPHMADADSSLRSE